MAALVWDPESLESWGGGIQSWTTHKLAIEPICKSAASPLRWGPASRVLAIERRPEHLLHLQIHPVYIDTHVHMPDEPQPRETFVGHLLCITSAHIKIKIKFSWAYISLSIPSSPLLFGYSAPFSSLFSIPFLCNYK